MTVLVEESSRGSGSLVIVSTGQEMECSSEAEAAAVTGSTSLVDDAAMMENDNCRFSRAWIKPHKLHKLFLGILVNRAHLKAGNSRQRLQLLECLKGTRFQVVKPFFHGGCGCGCVGKKVVTEVAFFN
jgi:hypothetical protein